MIKSLVFFNTFAIQNGDLSAEVTVFQRVDNLPVTKKNSPGSGGQNFNYFHLYSASYSDNAGTRITARLAGNLG